MASVCHPEARFIGTRDLQLPHSAGKCRFLLVRPPLGWADGRVGMTIVEMLQSRAEA